MYTAGDIPTSVLKLSHAVSVLETRKGAGQAVYSPWPLPGWGVGTVQRGRDGGFRTGSSGSPCLLQCACRHGCLVVQGGECLTLPGPSCSPHYMGEGVTEEGEGEREKRSRNRRKEGGEGEGGKEERERKRARERERERTYLEVIL